MPFTMSGESTAATCKPGCSRGATGAHFSMLPERANGPGPCLFRVNWLSQKDNPEKVSGLTLIRQLDTRFR